MTVSAHQPHFLPWLGYFNKVAKSDVFIWLEDVQFRKNYFQNRTRIKGNQDELWLTLSVKKGSLHANINEIELVKNRDFQKITKTIKNYYSKAPFFESHFKEIKNIINNSNDSLNDLNFDLFIYLLKVLEIKTEIIKSAELQIKEKDANNRLIEICKKVNATKYIAGKGGRNYMNEAHFKEYNIDVIWQEFPINEIKYQQAKGDFVEGLSILDVLFNIGKEKTKELVNTPWKS
jgi:hypothetical protein